MGMSVLSKNFKNHCPTKKKNLKTIEILRTPQ